MVSGSLGAEVQESEVTGVDVTLERLQPVTVALDCADLPGTVGQHVGFDVRQAAAARACPR